MLRCWPRCWIVLLLCLCAMPSWAKQPDPLGDIEPVEIRLVEFEANIDQKLLGLQNLLDHAWTLLCSVLVLMLVLGIGVKALNERPLEEHAAFLKAALLGAILSWTLYYVIGFGLVYGTSSSIFPSLLHAPFGWMLLADWSYRAFILDAACIIVPPVLMALALAGRIERRVFLALVAMYQLIIYPIYARWVWGNTLLEDNIAWLGDRGFIDYAGGTVVFSTTAWVILAALLRLEEETSAQLPLPRLEPLNGRLLVSTLLVIIGMFGFSTGASTLASIDFVRVFANSFLATMMAGTASLLVGWLRERHFAYHLFADGTLAGAVAIASGCDAVTTSNAVLIGLIVGTAIPWAPSLLERASGFRDTTHIMTRYGLAGVIGTLLAGILAMDDKLAAITRLNQMITQLQGTILCFLWSFGITYALLSFYQRWWQLTNPRWQEIMQNAAASPSAAQQETQLRQSIQHLLQNTSSLGAQTVRLSSQVHEMQRVVEQIENTHTVSAKVGRQTLEHTYELQHVMNETEGATTAVTALAEQLHTLSINTSLELAHAGAEAVRFSAIGEALNQLAENAKQLANSLPSTLTKASLQSKGLNTLMQEVAKIMETTRHSAMLLQVAFQQHQLLADSVRESTLPLEQKVTDVRRHFDRFKVAVCSTGDAEGMDPLGAILPSVLKLKPSILDRLRERLQ
jgi:Amt family ammonium transporter